MERAHRRQLPREAQGREAAPQRGGGEEAGTRAGVRARGDHRRRRGGCRWCRHSWRGRRDGGKTDGKNRRHFTRQGTTQGQFETVQTRVVEGHGRARRPVRARRARQHRRGLRRRHARSGRRHGRRLRFKHLRRRDGPSRSRVVRGGG